MTVPAQPKVYHIVHVDRLPSIIASHGLFSDSTMSSYTGHGTTIGMSDIKARRLDRSVLNSHPGLHVGQCVPFYFCPRSIMLYLIHCANQPGLSYRGGQAPIVHLECDLNASVEWAEENSRRWAFTLSNAGSSYFEDRSELGSLHEINWDAVLTNRWSGAGISKSVKEGKQAEFLVENGFPWELVERIGVFGQPTYLQATRALAASAHKPQIEVKSDWYY